MSLEKKLSDLTIIPEKDLKKLTSYIDAVHSHDVATQLVDDNTVFELNTFEGSLFITLEDDVLKYKFIPNENFAKIIKATLITKKSLLIERMSEKLKESLVHRRKELL